MKERFSYLKIGYQPNRRREIVAVYRLEPAKGGHFAETAQAIAAESSIGTWTHLKTLSEDVFKDFGG